MERKNGGRWLRGSKQGGKEGGSGVERKGSRVERKGSKVERKESKVKRRKQGGKVKGRIAERREGAG